MAGNARNNNFNRFEYSAHDNYTHTPAFSPAMRGEASAASSFTSEPGRLPVAQQQVQYHQFQYNLPADTSCSLGASHRPSWRRKLIYFASLGAGRSYGTAAYETHTPRLLVGHEGRRFRRKLIYFASLGAGRAAAGPSGATISLAMRTWTPGAERPQEASHDHRGRRGRRRLGWSRKSVLLLALPRNVQPLLLRLPVSMWMVSQERFFSVLSHEMFNPFYYVFEYFAHDNYSMYHSASRAIRTSGRLAFERAIYPPSPTNALQRRPTLRHPRAREF
ncbi:hypothetical protein EXIGLDRAFT_778011 [Exidia glandulosa HHB12029]|uniref:HECT domain-containing protein n=1 Tax=Exidia glandulosa HHB12029 TaxID=1314781 RepID=A0A165CRV6_EXIGL|nr:hypothetical protein EXIGLDRAFT_778011 [Exidia glandulosa HHB12029]